MMLLVDTSVWSLALRRDVVADLTEVWHLEQALLGAQTVMMTGLIFQELLRGFPGPRRGHKSSTASPRCRWCSPIDKTMSTPRRSARHAAAPVCKSEPSMP